MGVLAPIKEVPSPGVLRCVKTPAHKVDLVVRVVHVGVEEAEGLHAGAAVQRVMVGRVVRCILQGTDLTGYPERRRSDILSHCNHRSAAAECE